MRKNENNPNPFITKKKKSARLVGVVDKDLSKVKENTTTSGRKLSLGAVLAPRVKDMPLVLPLVREGMVSIHSAENFIVYFIDNGDEANDIVDQIKGTRSFLSNARFVNCRTAYLDNLIENCKDANEKVFIYINEPFLKSRVGMEDLIQLLYYHIFNVLLDFDINFLFDAKVLEGNTSILTSEGRVHYFKYWTEKHKYYAEAESDAGTVITEDSFFAAEKRRYMRIMQKCLSVLVVLNGISTKFWDPNADFKKVQYLQPFIKTVRNLPAENLNRIYSSANSKEDIKGFYFLCVTAFEDYYYEHSRMMEYFKSFNDTLSNANKIFRIFVVKGTTVKRKGWHSLLSEEQNKLILKYLMLNKMTGAQSYLMMYNVDHMESVSNDFLLEQDYALKIDSYGTWKVENLYQIAHDRLEVNPYYSQHPDAASEEKLYLAYPSDLHKNKQMLTVTGLQNISRFYEDFKRRARILLTPPNNEVRLIQFEDNNLDIIKSYLNLNHFNNEFVTELRQDISKVFSR
jgi:hypothetical protein